MSYQGVKFDVEVTFSEHGPKFDTLQEAFEATQYERNEISEYFEVLLDQKMTEWKSKWIEKAIQNDIHVDDIRKLCRSNQDRLSLLKGLALFKKYDQFLEIVTEDDFSAITDTVITTHDEKFIRSFLKINVKWKDHIGYWCKYSLLNNYDNNIYTIVIMLQNGFKMTEKDKIRLFEVTKSDSSERQREALSFLETVDWNEVIIEEPPKKKAWNSKG